MLSICVLVCSFSFSMPFSWSDFFLWVFSWFFWFSKAIWRILVLVVFLGVTCCLNFVFMLTISEWWRDEISCNSFECLFDMYTTSAASRIQTMVRHMNMSKKVGASRRTRRRLFRMLAMQPSPGRRSYWWVINRRSRQFSDYCSIHIFHTSSWNFCSWLVRTR